MQRQFKDGDLQYFLKVVELIGTKNAAYLYHLPQDKFNIFISQLPPFLNILRLIKVSPFITILDSLPAGYVDSLRILPALMRMAALRGSLAVAREVPIPLLRPALKDLDESEFKALALQIDSVVLPPLSFTAPVPPRIRARALPAKRKKLNRFDFTDEQFEKVKAVSTTSVASMDKMRVFLSAVVYRFQTRLPWKEVAEMYQTNERLYKRFSYWKQEHPVALRNILNLLSTEYGMEFLVTLDDTTLNTRQPVQAAASPVTEVSELSSPSEILEVPEMPPIPFIDDTPVGSREDVNNATDIPELAQEGFFEGEEEVYPWAEPEIVPQQPLLRKRSSSTFFPEPPLFNEKKSKSGDNFNFSHS